MIHIAFEGPDGVGKSTIIGLLAKKLADYKVTIARHPGFTDFGDMIQKIIKFPKSNGINDHQICDRSIQLMMMAEYAQFEKVVEEHYQGHIILSDRCNMISGYIYGTAAGLPPRMFHNLIDVVRPRLLDGLFMVSAPLELVQQRLEERVKDSFEERHVLFHELVRKKYSNIARSGYARKIVSDRNVYNVRNDIGIDDIVTDIANTIIGKYLSRPLVERKDATSCGAGQ